MGLREKRFVTTAEIAYRLTSQRLAGYTHRHSRRNFELPQLAACVVMKFHLGLSYREMERWLSRNDEVCQIFGLPRVPDHTTLQKTYKKLQNLDFEKIKNQIIEEKHKVEADTSPWISRLMVIWLSGMAALLPIKILNLPLNFEMVDIWTMGGIPVMLYLFSLRRPRTISPSFIIPMWFVLISSLISALTSHSPVKSTIVILKEVYLFVWFFVALAILFQINARDMRRVLRVWSIVVIFHGALMVAQFISPEIWQFTNSLGGNSARLEGYRAAGLFICDKAGCANKAAFFQLLGFVPLLVAGYSKKTTVILGFFIFASMMTTGSMGATLAFTSGLIVSIIAIAYFKKNLSLVIMNFVRIGLALILLGGVFYTAGTQSPEKLHHFERIIIGRYDKSSGGRFDLWGRGIDVLLEHNAFFWGVGPENFRLVDAAQKDNQLHNDTLAFLVERGLIGLTGLALFAGITLRKAIRILQLSRKYPKRAGFGVVVFLAALVATVVESLTHQIFHTRELWLVLALQEAVLYKMTISEHGIEPPVRTVQAKAQFHSSGFHGPELLPTENIFMHKEKSRL